MNLLIHFIEFDIIFCIEDNIVEKVYEFWKNCLDICYIDFNIEVKDAWTIYAKKVPEGDENHFWDFEEKIIVNYYSCPHDLTEHNAFLRECITKIALYSGILWVHASAFRIREKVVLVLGEKNAGKTTWVLNAVINLNAEFIGNDQLPLFLCEGKLSTVGWRPDVKIRSSSLEVLGINDKGMVQADRHYLQLNGALEVDIEGLSAKNGYSIEKIDCWNSKIHTCFMETVNVDNIIYIGKIREGNNISYFWKKVFEDDRENLLPHYLCDWCENMNYWTERIGNIRIASNARKNEMKIYNHLKKIPVKILDSRMSIEGINKFLIYDM